MFYSRMQIVAIIVAILVQFTHSYIKYDEAEAQLFLNLAAAAYPTPGNTSLRDQCIYKTYPDDQYGTSQAMAVPCDKKGNLCQAYVAVSNISYSVIVSFRGTDGASQLMQEFKYGLQDYMLYNETNINGTVSTCGRVNKYFYRAMDIVWNELIEPIAERYHGYRYLVTGHSLGGALAALAAYRLSYRGVVANKYYVRMYTFGEPREGDYAFAQYFQVYVPYSFRVVHYTDPVVHLPPLNEADPTLDAHPFHHTREIWYNKAFTSYTLCNETYGEDPNCSDKKRFWTYGEKAMFEHLHYFNHYISEYGWNGCNSSANIILSMCIIIPLLVNKFL